MAKWWNLNIAIRQIGELAKRQIKKWRKVVCRNGGICNVRVKSHLQHVDQSEIDLLEATARDTPTGT